MSDVNLLMFGCAVTFIGVGGAYIYLRERYLASKLPKRKPVPEPRRRDARFMRDVA